MKGHMALSWLPGTKFGIQWISKWKVPEYKPLSKNVSIYIDINQWVSRAEGSSLSFYANSVYISK